MMFSTTTATDVFSVDHGGIAHECKYSEGMREALRSMHAFPVNIESALNQLC